MTQRILARRGRVITAENSRWWTLGAMCFALFMIMLDRTVPKSTPRYFRTNPPQPPAAKPPASSLGTTEGADPEARSLLPDVPFEVWIENWAPPDAGAERPAPSLPAT